MVVFIGIPFLFTSDSNHSIDTTGQADSFASFAKLGTFSNSEGTVGGTLWYIGSLRGGAKVTKSTHSIASESWSTSQISKLRATSLFLFLNTLRCHNRTNRTKVCMRNNFSQFVFIDGYQNNGCGINYIHKYIEKYHLLWWQIGLIVVRVAWSVVVVGRSVVRVPWSGVVIGRSLCPKPILSVCQSQSKANESNNLKVICIQK